MTEHKEQGHIKWDRTFLPSMSPRLAVRFGLSKPVLILVVYLLLNIKKNIKV